MHQPRDITAILERFPKARPPLPLPYQDIYQKEYLINRSGDSGFLYRLIHKMEAWEHHLIASRSRPGPLLELGPGMLNHVPFESDDGTAYDVVEPNRFFLEGSPDLKRIRKIFADISEIPEDERYGRIFSVGVLEHLEELPRVVARSALLLNDQGLFQAGLPMEGGFLWGAGWRLTTGLAFRIRTGLNYKIFMRHEHINSAREMVAVIRHFFGDVSCRYFPFRHFSIYVAVEAWNPKRDVCRAFLDQYPPA
jgi:hypothetical protein